MIRDGEAVLGTDPAAQGRGLGSAVLAPVLEGCDRDGIGAYLVSSKERNIDFYARFGFRVTREVRLPRPSRLADVARRRLSRGRRSPRGRRLGEWRGTSPHGC
jgi:GNAT superfamily N-acetyltransferase